MTTMDIMIDIETMSTATDALVLSVGITPFVCHEAGIQFADALLVVPDLVEQLVMGRRVDRETQLWWQRQPDEAQAHWRYPGTCGYSVGPALSNIHSFITKIAPKRVWARGPHFDIAILDNLFSASLRKSPWGYNSIRDVRTYCDDEPKMKEWQGTNSPLPPHHPLADNYNQIVDLWEHGLGRCTPYTPDPRDRECAGGPAETKIVLP